MIIVSQKSCRHLLILLPPPPPRAQVTLLILVYQFMIYHNYVPCVNNDDSNNSNNNNSNNNNSNHHHNHCHPIKRIHNRNLKTTTINLTATIATSIVLDGYTESVKIWGNALGQELASLCLPCEVSFTLMNELERSLIARDPIMLCYQRKLFNEVCFMIAIKNIKSSDEYLFRAKFYY